MKQSGSTQDSLHSFSDEEKRGYVEYVNRTLQGDVHVSEHLPIDPATMQLFELLGSTLILPRLVNKGFPDELPMTQLVLKPKNNFQIIENHNKTLAAAKKIGCRIVNVSAEDLTAGTAHLVMGVLWQVIKAILLKDVAEAARQSAGEDAFPDSLPPEQMITKWANARLKAAQCKREMTNFAGDLDDGEIYAYLLYSCEPEIVTPTVLRGLLDEKDKLTRVELVLVQAERLGLRKFVTATEVVKGNPRLNLAFLATLFKAYPQLRTFDTAKVDALAAEVTQVRAALDESNQRAQRAAQEKDELGGSVQELQSKLSDAEAARRAAKQRCDELEEAAAAAGEQAAARAKELEALEGQMEAMAASLASERAERVAREKERDALQEELGASRAELEAKERAMEEAARAAREALAAAEEQREALKAALQAEKDNAAARELEHSAELADFRARHEQEVQGLTAQLQEKADLLAVAQQALETSEAQRREEEERWKAAEAALRQEMADERARMEAEAAALRTAVAEEKAAKEANMAEVGALKAELERTRAEATATEADLRGEVARLEGEAEDMKRDFADREAALKTRIAELEARVAELEAEVERLKAELENAKRSGARELEEEVTLHTQTKQSLAEERAARELMEDELQDMQDEVEEVREEAEDEKMLLLQRIKDLEEELQSLKEVMENSLDKAARERAEALAAAQAAKKKELEEAEAKRLEELRKVRGVMAAVACEGFLLKQSGGFRGAWNKRYFVLQGNIMTWYRNEKEFKDSKPKGLIKVEEVRIYEIGDKRQFAFSLEPVNDSQNKTNLAGLNLEDMKKWVNAIKEAKKKHIAQKVVISDNS